MAFHFLDKDIIGNFIYTMIRPKLEYAKVIWSPHKKKHVLKLERIQRIATKMVPDLEDLTWKKIKSNVTDSNERKKRLNYNI